MKGPFLAALVLFAITAAIVVYKVYALDYHMAMIDEEPGHYVRLVMTMTSKSPDSPINVHVTLPLEDERQTIRKEIYREEGFVHDIEWEDGNRIANFRGENLKGEQSITYSFRAQTSSMKFNLPEATIIPATSPSNLKRWLETEEYIESDDPAILAKSEELMKGDRRIDMIPNQRLPDLSQQPILLGLPGVQEAIPFGLLEEGEMRKLRVLSRFEVEIPDSFDHMMDFLQ
ncbi:MAG: hypothetical protein KC917_19135, partial [Candidatus Omnitrophica bacterium]|nr:hypothetical protein [Candidatus Omnitrophota bacterium]